MDKQTLKALLKELLQSEEISLEVVRVSESEEGYERDYVRVKLLIDGEVVSEAYDYRYIKN